MAGNVTDLASWKGTVNTLVSYTDEMVPPIQGAPVTRHEFKHAVSEAIYSHYVPAGLVPGTVYCASIWVWIPEKFSGLGISILFNGYAAVGSAPIDLEKNGLWQRTWVTAAIPDGAQNADLALFVSAAGENILYTSCPQLEIGAGPSDAVQAPGCHIDDDGPAVTLSRSIFQRELSQDSPELVQGSMAVAEGVLILSELSSCLSASQDNAPGNHLGIEAVDVVVPAGTYTRRAMYDLDMSDASPETKASTLAYTRAPTTRYADSVIVKLRNAIVAGEGTVVIGDRVILLDSMREYLAYGRRLDGFELVRPGVNYRLERTPAQTIVGPTILIGRPFYANFGHWLVEGATQIALLSDKIAPDWKIAVSKQKDARMSNVVLATVRACLPDRNVVVIERPDDESWRFEELHYGSPLHVPPLFKLPEAIERLSTAMLSHVRLSEDRHVSGPGRVFISRRKLGHRRIANESELTPVLEKHGFVTICPEELGFEEQIRIFRDAEAVIGAKGAGLTGIMFCDPAAIAIMLSPSDNPDPFFWDLAGLRNMRYAELFGPITTAASTPGFNDFEIDPVKLERMLSLLFRTRGQQRSGR